MSAKAVKATNRQIRKAFGGQAAESIADVVKTVNDHSAAIGQIIGAFQQGGPVHTLDGQVKELSELKGRGFFGRVKWLILGR